MKKRLLTIFLFPFLLLTGCDSVSSTKRPTSIYNEEPLSLLWDSDSSSLREWYKTHDFTMYSTNYNDDVAYQGYGIILIHSAKYDYSYFAMYLNEKATGSSYEEPHEELYVGKTKEHYLLVGDLSYHNEYQGELPLYSYFSHSINFFKKCDPGYKEKVDLGTNRFYSTSNDVSLYSFRTKKKLKSVTFNHASSSYYSVPAITYSV